MDAQVPNSTAPTKEAPPAAYFQSLTVENLRCFGPTQPLELMDEGGKPCQWTIILGENGVGKTTLLQLLALQRPKPRTIELHDRTVLVPEAYERIAWPYGTGDEFGMKNPQRDLQIGSVITIGDRLSNWTGQHQKSHNIVTTKTFNRGWSSEVSDSLSGFACFGYGASRRMGTVSLYDENNRQDPCASLFSDRSELLSPIEWLMTTDYASKIEDDNQQQAKRRLDIVESLLGILIPDISNYEFVRSVNTGRVDIRVRTPYGDVSINSLSLGHKTSLTWIVDLADRLFTRYPQSPDPIAEPAIVLVDEIDLHLHPKWQRRIIQQLTAIFKNTQFIVTAHSPLVVQAALDANIVLLKQEGDHVLIENNLEAVRNWRVDQILTSDLFGLPTARPPQIDRALEERTKIMSKARLTARDKQRLAELETTIGHMPAGDTLEEDEAMNLILQIAEAAKSAKAA